MTEDKKIEKIFEKIIVKIKNLQVFCWSMQKMATFKWYNEKEVEKNHCDHKEMAILLITKLNKK